VAYAVRASIREGGVTYRSPDEAYAAAAVLEADAEQRADEYRRNGDDGLADTTVDRGHAAAERLRTWARQREEFEAKQTAQPPDAPKPKRPPPTRAPRAPRAPSARAPRRFAGRSGSFARKGYRRSGAQAAVVRATGLGWYVAGATIGVALLTLFLTKRGTTAFADLTGFAATALRIVVDPVDPLRPHLLDEYVQQAQAANAGPAVPLPPPARTRPSVATTRQLAVNRRPMRSRGAVV
jgi:hypothetical protein